MRNSTVKREAENFEGIESYGSLKPSRMVVYVPLGIMVSPFLIAGAFEIMHLGHKLIG